MDRIRTNTTTNRPLPHTQRPPSPGAGKGRPGQTTINSALLFGKSLNSGADTILSRFSQFGVDASSTLKDLDRLAGTTGFLGNILKIEDTLKETSTGSPKGFLSGLIRTGAGIFDAVTGVVSIAEASAADRNKGDTTYSGTMKAIGKSMGKMTVGALATAGIVACAPAAAPTLAVGIVGGALVTGTMIASGRVLDYILG